MVKGLIMNIIDMSTEGLSTEEIIEFRKILNQHIKNARKKSQHKNCLLCGKESSFCNSHTIPQFCLRNIAWNGKLNSINTLIASELFDKDSGINNAGTFHIICRPCDNNIFQDYEKEEAYVICPTETALNQIALKTSLRDIYKHEMEIEMLEASKQIVKEKSPFFSFFLNKLFDAQIDARKRDIQECYEVFNTTKKHLTSSDSWVKLISFDKLAFTAPIAFQGMIALVTGMNGETINDIFNHKRNYSMEYLHVAVFPLETSTAIMLFMDSKNTRYAQFEKSISSLSQNQRLEIINRIIFLYTEDYYLSKQIDEETIKWLQEPAKLIQDMVTNNPKKSIKNAVKDYDLRRDICIPNLFLKEYAVKIQD